MARRLQATVMRHVRALIGLPKQELLDRRLEKYLKMGVYLEEAATVGNGAPDATPPESAPPPA
jgi:hypothetical protein